MVTIKQRGNEIFLSFSDEWLRNTVDINYMFLQWSDVLDYIAKKEHILNKFNFVETYCWVFPEYYTAKTVKSLFEYITKTTVEFSVEQDLIEAIKIAMVYKKLNQKKLAELLDYPAARLSEFLKGKRKLNVKLAKKLYLKLNIDPKVILSWNS